MQSLPQRTSNSLSVEVCLCVEGKCEGGSDTYNDKVNIKAGTKRKHGCRKGYFRLIVAVRRIVFVKIMELLLQN